MKWKLLLKASALQRRHRSFYISPAVALWLFFQKHIQGGYICNEEFQSVGSFSFHRNVYGDVGACGLP